MKNLLKIIATVFFLIEGGLLLGQTSSCYQPKNNLYTADTLITFSANRVAGAVSYRFQISSTNDFSNIQHDTTLAARDVLLQLPNINTQYYWRTKSYLIGDSTNWSSFFILNLFSPKNISNTILWLSSKNINLPNNTLVDSWNDLSNYSYHATQANSALKPLYKINGGVRNNAYVDFVGTDGMSTAINNSDIPNDSTLGFISLNINRNQGYGALFFLGNSGSFAPQYAARTAGSSYNNGAMRFLGYNGSIFTFDLQTPNSSHKIITGINTKLTAKLFSSGIPMSTSIANIIPVAAGATLKIGSNQDFTDNYNGGVHELIMLKNTSDTSIYHKIEKFIDCRYVPRANLGGNIFKYNGFCDSTVTLSPGSGYASYVWSTLETSPTINVSSFGTYSVTVVDEFGYLHFDQIDYKPNLNLRYPTANFICSGDSILWNPQVPSGYSVHWSDGSIGPIKYINSGGSFSFEVVDAFSCAYQSDTIIFNIDNYAQTVYLGADTSLCVDNLIALQIGAAETVGYDWNGTSTIGQPSFWAVDTTGNYFVESTNINGCIARDTIHITISGQAPIANFSFQNQCFGLPNAFADLSVGLPTDAVVLWNWDLGDGNTNTTQSPLYTYDTTGTYTVQLYVESAGGCGAFHTETVTVHGLPTASFTKVGNCSGQSVQFTNTSAIGDAPIAAYLWNFDQPWTGSANTSTVPTPFRTFDSAGTYDVSLQVTDTNGCVNDTIIPLVIDQSPVIAFTAPDACANAQIAFTNTSAVEAPATYLWDFGDLTSSILAVPVKYYSNIGIHTITLTATAGNGCFNTLQQQMYVHPNPVAAMTFGPMCMGTYTSLMDNSTVVSGSIASYLWVINSTDSLTGPTNNYVFNSLGQQQVVLQVTSDMGCTSMANQFVDVTEALDASFTVSSNIIAAGEPITFTNTTPTLSIVSWDFGDGNSLNFVSPTTYQYGSNYIDSTVTVSMFVSNVLGCMDTATMSISIEQMNLDLSLSNLYVQDINGFYTIGIELKNEGSITITHANLKVLLPDGPLASEVWNGILIPGASVIYIFNSSIDAYIPTSNNEEAFLCATGIGFDMNNNAEVFLDNNKVCKNLVGEAVVLLPIYPNPASNQVTIELLVTITADVSLELLDARGRLIKTILPTQALASGLYTYEADISQIQAGTYFVRMRNGDVDVVNKLMISNY